MEERFFEDAINHNPADLDTRRAYCDWLYEHERMGEYNAWQMIMHKVPYSSLGWFGEDTLEKEEDIPHIVSVEIFRAIPYAYEPFVALTKLARYVIEHNLTEVR